MSESAETTATTAELATDADPVLDRPRARERGRMRRRLRSQKRMREALLLDLGALVYELHRQGRREPELLQAKAAELTAVDEEVRGLAEALDADLGMLAVVATGVAGSCEKCGSLLSTDSRYCSACGSPAVPALAGQHRTETELPHAPKPIEVSAAPVDATQAHEATPVPEAPVVAGGSTGMQAPLPEAAEDPDVEPELATHDEAAQDDEPVADPEPASYDVPAVDEEPAFGHEPLADQEPAFDDQPVAGQEPEADEPPAPWLSSPTPSPDPPPAPEFKREPARAPSVGGRPRARALRRIAGRARPPHDG